MNPTNSESHPIRSSLDTMTKKFLQDRGLVVVSNRGPVQYELKDGQLHANRGSGGLVTAIGSLSSLVPFTWVASALSEGDRYAAQENDSIPVAGSTSRDGLSVRYVLNPLDTYSKYYNIISNSFLWFVQHYMWDTIYGNIDRSIYDAWDNGYVLVNKSIAETVAVEALKIGDSPIVMIQDYQLYLAGTHVREALPEAIIQHFIHIPWPAPRYWAMLPAPMRNAILKGLCSCDIVGFQTSRDTENFIATCQDLLPEAEIDLSPMSVRYKGRETYARHYPISIDVAQVREVSASMPVKQNEDRLRELASEKVIVRVDRLDPTKNILRGFKAYELLLSTHLELWGKVTFLAFLVPSRTGIVEYQRYMEGVLEAIDSINENFGNDDWKPVHLFYEENYFQAIAGMRIADVILVNPVIDGMNLVAKEAPIVNEQNCALVLSQTVGAYEQLKEFVIPVSPTDTEGTSVALYEALTMDENERARRIEGMRRSIEGEDITNWLRSQLEDLSGLDS